jgi:hypothetical protein
MSRKNVKMNHKLPGSEGLSTESAVLAIEIFGGAEGVRTPDPLNANLLAMVTTSHIRYGLERLY